MCFFVSHDLLPKLCEIEAFIKSFGVFFASLIVINQERIIRWEAGKWIHTNSFRDTALFFDRL
jgi:hypothetical protein